MVVTENTIATTQTPAKQYIGQEIPLEFLKKAGYYETTVANSGHVEPLYSLAENGDTIGNLLL